jgi:very-short-patch-repair endonuclease
MSKANNTNYHLYNKNLKEYASENRNDSTKAEACMWKFVLSSKKMKGYSFRRQRPVLQYIADFMCKELKLIIEVDGISHSWEKVAAKDEARQKALEVAGFVVLRYTDEEVLTGIQSVFEKVDACIEELEMRRGIVH